MTIPKIPRPDRITTLILILSAAMGWETRSPTVAIEVCCVILLIREGFVSFISWMES